MARKRAMCLFAAAEPFLSLPPLRVAPRERDFGAVRGFERRVPLAVRFAARRERRGVPRDRDRPSAVDIICACAPVTSPGMIKTDLSPTVHHSLVPPLFRFRA